MKCLSLNFSIQVNPKKKVAVMASCKRKWEIETRINTPLGVHN